MTLFIIKQKAINQESSRRLIRRISMSAIISILCMFIRMDGVTYVEIQFYHLKFHNSINLWKNGQKHHKGFYSEGFSYIKLIKICKKKPVKKRVVYSWVWCHFQKNLCSFITSWKLAKTLQIFVWGPSSIKLTKIYHKKRGEVLASGLL